MSQFIFLVSKLDEQLSILLEHSSLDLQKQYNLLFASFQIFFKQQLQYNFFLRSRNKSLMQLSLKELILQKDKMEKEIAQLHQYCEKLDATKNVSKNLVDHEGFPRADLNYEDLLNYRTKRKRLNQLNNDHLALMKKIQKGLFQLHQQYMQNPTIQQEFNKKQQVVNRKEKQIENYQIKPKKQKQPYKIQYLTPFAKISLVEQNSPAFEAGLFSGDLLSEIGDINIYTPDCIKSIPKVVAEGRELKVVVLRYSQDKTKQIFQVRGQPRIKITVNVIPKRWSGRGLLGCKIDPI